VTVYRVLVVVVKALLDITSREGINTQDSIHNRTVGSRQHWDQPSSLIAKISRGSDFIVCEDNLENRLDLVSIELRQFHFFLLQNTITVYSWCNHHELKLVLNYMVALH
jgi:hypothetical protein